MRITILNGDMESGKGRFSEYIERLADKMGESHTVKVFPLSQMNLHYCTGCFGCWWKTPGLCAIADDAGKIFSSYINADFVIFASPLVAGFTSSSLKKITDRLIVLLHPYIELRNGECHHGKRYSKYPDIGLLLERETHTDEADLSIVGDIYSRFAVNFHCQKKYIKTIDNSSIDDIVHETCHN
ncbi:MAG: NAD(P)H-dependent oxidoreductase [Bacteroidales bacterium]